MRATVLDDASPRPPWPGWLVRAVRRCIPALGLVVLSWPLHAQTPAPTPAPAAMPAPTAPAEVAAPVPPPDAANDEPATAEDEDDTPDSVEPPPLDAEPAASDMVDSVVVPAVPDEPVDSAHPDVILQDPDAAEVQELGKLERQTVRYDLLPPVARPRDESRALDVSRSAPAVGLNVHRMLGTEPMETEFRRLRGEDERATLDALARSLWTASRPTLGPLGPIAGDIPLADNEMVQRWISFFRGTGSVYYRKWVARYWRYGPTMRTILQAEGVPSDTIFLSMIESGFSPRAYSFAHAAGPWQFIRSTGTRMGLRVDYWVDERRDPIKSTHAAARYLKELHRTWGDWHLAWASYNAGPGNVNKAVKRVHSREFFKLARTRHLRWETRNYVPKLIAAAVIGQDPALHGFGDVEPLPPFAFQEMAIPDSMSLQALARACGSDLETMQELNPELRRPMTPPRSETEPAYQLRVPPGALDRCRTGLTQLSPPELVRYRRVQVKAGDTVDSLAARFSTSATAILEENNLQPGRLRVAEDLIIPVPPGPAIPLGDMQDEVAERRGGVAKAAQPRGTRAVKVVIQKGETLWDIASKYGVDVRSVSAWNGLNRRRRVKVGTAVVLYVKDTTPKPAPH